MATTVPGTSCDALQSSPTLYGVFSKHHLSMKRLPELTVFLASVTTVPQDPEEESN